ncbi:hypothetical protein LJC68_06545 [Bacteroidales bacterium OttesenSCG-928-B11]|nr:hypothetical protein [Bacteroidales bacterium OttesenSCG-928-E04]MDL2312518.1 hypothetical protein [Bacteroidales bacterium OttesenSCG-928-B11]MDL2326346.1 hypothetical protein [Bacteroidales bacterium OttesenSCG-928-A14]
MEKRLGIIAIVITGKNHIAEINDLISTFSDAIIARQGIPMPQRNISFISLIIEAPMNMINTLTGKLGRIDGVAVKTIVTQKESKDNEK